MEGDTSSCAIGDMFSDTAGLFPKFTGFTTTATESRDIATIPRTTGIIASEPSLGTTTIDPLGTERLSSATEEEDQATPEDTESATEESSEDTAAIDIPEGTSGDIVATEDDESDVLC